MKKKKEEAPKKEDPLAKLVKLTKLMKMENVRVAPKGPVRSGNKWRSSDPKFIEKEKTTEGLVEAGGMSVDPVLKEQYENWRKDKEEEQNNRRIQAQRKAKADEARRKAMKESQPDY